MNTRFPRMSRRQFTFAGCTLPLAIGAWSAAFAEGELPMIEKRIPANGETLCPVGLGTSRTFNREVNVADLITVTQAFFDAGGQLIDTSPMYGPAEALIGEVLPQIDDHGRLFCATKVWTDGRENGIGQMRESMRLMGRKRIDLMQIHNLRDWQLHLGTLREWKQQGLIRYIGITTSHGRFHAELASIMEKEPLDFVQFSYNLADREVEKRLLPLALERGIAVLVNRPFRMAELFAAVRGKPLPDWAAEIDCASWGQVFLKFTLSHPAVTCAIPATNKLKHLRDNMAAARGRLPDEALRKKMIALI